MTTVTHERVIMPRPLDAAAFAPYGQVLEAPRNGLREDYAGRLESGDPTLRANLALVRAKPRTLPLRVEAMERHNWSSQAFLPLAASRYLVLTCPSRADSSPDLERLQAFLCRGDQGINYDRGTWHHPMTALDAPATFAMFMWDELGARDTEWATIAEPVVIADG